MANQTIIQAAGQRYAPIKTDYSGYIKGIASVATALIDKKKTMSKNSANLEKMKSGLITDITPLSGVLKDFVDNPDYSTNMKLSKMESLKNKRDQFDEIKVNIAEMVGENGENLSPSIDPAIRSYLMSWAAGDFEKEITVKRRLKKSDTGEDYWSSMSFPMNFQIDLSNGWDNMDINVIGPEGDYISIDELSNLLNQPNIGDGTAITDEFNVFKYKTRDQDLETPQFNKLKEISLDKIKTLIDRGDKEKGISARNMQRSFMFDETFTIDGKETGFLEWYFENASGTIISDEFKAAYKDFIDEYQPGDEIEQESMNILAADLFYYDTNVVSDLKDFIDYILEKQRD